MKKQFHQILNSLSIYQVSMYNEKIIEIETMWRVVSVTDHQRSSKIVLSGPNIYFVNKAKTN